MGLGCAERRSRPDEQELGGVGFWAVCFDQVDEELWEAADDAFKGQGGEESSMEIW